uniref:Uncharacterized protein n=1 Tax=Glossina austeni TaxID=7395 RepID=A0A1A9V122_GLOAU
MELHNFVVKSLTPTSFSAFTSGITSASTWTSSYFWILGWTHLRLALADVDGSSIEQDFKYTYSLQLTSYEPASRNSPGFNKNRTKPEQSIGRPYTKHTAETKLKEIDFLNTTAPNVKDDKIPHLTVKLKNTRSYIKINLEQLLK